MLDLVKAFERVPHRRVVEAARKHGYNLWLLRLSLASYRLLRAVGVDGAYSQLLLATRGITAGSGFATFELRALLMDVVDDVCKNWKLVSISLYVDDMVISSAGPGMQAPIDVAGATDQAVRHMEDKEGLDLTVSVKKSVTSASSMALALATARLSKIRKIKATRNRSCWARLPVATRSVP